MRIDATCRSIPKIEKYRMFLNPRKSPLGSSASPVSPSDGKAG